MLQRFMSVVSGASLATGVQLVLLPWLAVGVLGAEAQQLGWVQASVLLPSLVFVLLGGVLADRYPSTRYLAVLYCLLFCGHVFLAYIAHTQQLNLTLLLLYGIFIGSVMAFIQPLRERLVASLKQHSLQRSVTLVNFFQYGFQAAGVLLAGQIDRLGLLPVIAVQLVALMFAAAMCNSLSSLSLPHRQLAAWTDGLRATWGNAITRSLIVLVAFNGFMHIGVFVVVLPLLVRDVYQLSADYYSWLQLSFVAGTLISTIVLLRREETDRPGRGLLFCLLYASLLLLAMAAGPTLSGIFMMVFIWGAITGVSSSLGRGLMQHQANEELRGRMVSIYQLALFGSAPLGALAAGYGVQLWGVHQVLYNSAYFSLGLFLLSWCFPALWQAGKSSDHPAKSN